LKIVLAIIALIFSISFGQINEHLKEFDWEIVKIDSISNESRRLVWSQVDDNKSSRLLYYFKPKEGQGKRKYVEAESRRVVLNNDSDNWRNNLTINGLAYVSINDILNQRRIFNLNGELLTEVKFNSDRVEYFCSLDDGQYLGLDYINHQIHYVYPELGLYKIITPRIMPDTYISGWEYNLNNGDIYIWGPNHSHLLFDKRGKIIWELQTEHMSHSIFSDSGRYIALMLSKYGLFKGEIQIYDRSGQLISTIETGFDVGMDFFSSDDKYLIVTESWKEVKLFEVETGELIQNCLLGGYRAVNDVAFSEDKEMIFVLHSKENPLESDRLLSVFEIGGNPKRPRMQYNLGYFNRNDKYSTHLSVSHDGNQITANSQGKIFTFEVK